MEKIIAVASDDAEGLQGNVSAHFGRCPFYTFVTVKDDQIIDARVVENPYFASHQPGEVPEFIKREKADVIISGGMGPRAIALFEQFNIAVATGAYGKVLDAVNAYLSGQLAGSAPCSDHDGSKHHHHREN